MAQKQDKTPCKCPYCDGPVDPAAPFCVPCTKEFKVCKACGKPVPGEAKRCPHCGSER